MKHDITQAMEVERLYLLETNHIDTLPLVDRLSEFGYDLPTYFKDKLDWLVSNSGIRIQNYLLDDVKSAMLKAMETGTSSAFSIDEDCTWMWVGDQDVDETLASKLGVKLCKLGYRGGNIVTCNSDFNVALNFPREIPISSTYFLDKMNSFLQNKGYDTHIDRNDIMIGETKVAGSSFYGTGRSGMFFMSMSLTDHSELVSRLCTTKPQVKVPGFVSGLTREEVEQEVNGWLQHI